MLFNAAGDPLPTEIQLRTRADSPIENKQLWHLSAFEWGQFAQSLDQHPRATIVGDACPIYNCHGLTLGAGELRFSRARPLS